MASLTIADALLFWLSQFVGVFLAGHQSRNVNSGRYVGAAVTSLMLAASQVALIRGLVEAPPLLAFLLLATAGPSAICTAMWSHGWLERRRGR